MKIKVSFTVDVHEDVWSEEYGVDPSRVRSDVQEHARQTVLQHFDSIGVLQ